MFVIVIVIIIVTAVFVAIYNSNSIYIQMERPGIDARYLNKTLYEIVSFVFVQNSI